MGSEAPRGAQVGRVARRGSPLRALREVGVVGDKPATREGARAFRAALDELGTGTSGWASGSPRGPTYCPDVYIEELGQLVDEGRGLSFAELEPDHPRGSRRRALRSDRPEPAASASIAQIHQAILRTGRGAVEGAPARGGGARWRATSTCSARHHPLRSATPSTARMAPARCARRRARCAPLAQSSTSREEARTPSSSPRSSGTTIELRCPQVIRPLCDRAGADAGADRRSPGSAEARAPPASVAKVLARQFFRRTSTRPASRASTTPIRSAGNILLTKDGRLALLDFGLLGRLDDDTRRVAGRCCCSRMAQNRADDVADLIISLSLTTVKSDQPGFVHDVRRKLPRFHWRPLSGDSGGRVARRPAADRARPQHPRCRRASRSSARRLRRRTGLRAWLDPDLDPIGLMENEVDRGDDVSRQSGGSSRTASSLLPLHAARSAGRGCRAASSHVLACSSSRAAWKIGIQPTGLDELEEEPAPIGEPPRRRRDHHRRPAGSRPPSSCACTSSSGSGWSASCSPLPAGLSTCSTRSSARPASCSRHAPLRRNVAVRRRLAR